MIACDFFTVDTVVLKRIYVLVFIEHGTRLLHMAGVTANPTGAWVTQQTRNLAMELGERMDSLTFLIRDRDAKVTAAFDEVFRASGVRIIKTPLRAPRANAICERVVGTLRREVFDHMLIFNEKHLAKVLAEYIEHYDEPRPHQSRQQRPPAIETNTARPITNLADIRTIRRHPVLDGLTSQYHRAA
jgi:putative transposase